LSFGGCELAAGEHRTAEAGEKQDMAYNPEAIRRTYDTIAHREDEFEKEHSLRNEIPRQFIKRYLRATDVVLDGGGGAGINAIMMAQRCGRVTLVDISPEMLER